MLISEKNDWFFKHPVKLPPPSQHTILSRMMFEINAELGLQEAPTGTLFLQSCHSAVPDQAPEHPYPHAHFSLQSTRVTKYSQSCSIPLGHSEDHPAICFSRRCRAGGSPRARSTSEASHCRGRRCLFQSRKTGCAEEWQRADRGQSGLPLRWFQAAGHHQRTE